MVLQVIQVTSQSSSHVHKHKYSFIYNYACVTTFAALEQTNTAMHPQISFYTAEMTTSKCNDTQSCNLLYYFQKFNLRV